MKVVFASNYFNHHQEPFCEEMFKLLGDNFIFIQTQAMEIERKSMGWKEKSPTYVKHSYHSKESYYECINLINESDIVIMGSAPFKYIKDRLKKDKYTFFYKERLFKKGFLRVFFPHTFIKVLNQIYFPSKKKKTYMLCASAYTSIDVNRVFAYRDKTLKWGYFPKNIQHNLDELFKNKNNNVTEILWVGRMIDWKHCEHALEIAKRLKSDGYIFNLNIIGNGELEGKLREIRCKYNLEDCVNFLGTMSPELVRGYMERANIFLFTSDFNEGWGAVLNEAMNSACAVVASHAIGSVPFLLKNNKNGLIYKYGNIDDFYRKVKLLMDDKNLQLKLGENAYNTLKDEWNEKEGAKRFIKLVKNLLEGKDTDFKEGPCSKAEILRNDWW